MRVLVCGSRTFTDENLVSTILTGLYTEYQVGHMVAYLGTFTLIEGGAKGADACAAWWAMSSPMHSHKLEPTNHDLGFEWLQFKADWDTHGKAAGPIRNQKMLEEGKPDVCYAFIDKALAESRGTFDMVDRCRKAGVPVVVVRGMEPFLDGDDAIPLSEFKETFGI